MCINLNFFKNIFGGKESGETTETEITSGTATNGETVPGDNNIFDDMDEPIIIEINTPVTPEKPDYSGFVVLLDNGHAKSTFGKRSPRLDDGRQFFEYEFNRDVVARIAKALDKLGIRNYVLVPEVEKDIALSERARRANEYCKEYGKDNCFFISVHSNAYGMGEKWETPGKWSVWTTAGETKSDEYGKVLYKVAEEMLEPYGFGCRDGKVQGNGNPGPDYEENFTVIYKTNCPAVLTENLFYTNKKECEWLMTDIGRQVIADIHVEGIKRIIESRK